MGLGLGWEVRDLPRYLGQDQPVYGLRPSALLGNRNEKPSAQSIAAHYVKAIRAVRPHGPYVLGGGCAAGIVAFEMAQRLVALGESAPLLVLFDVDYPPPSFLPGRSGVWLLRLPRELARLRKMRAREQWSHIRRQAQVWKARIFSRSMPSKHDGGHSSTDESSREPGTALELLLAPLRDCVWRYRPQLYRGRIALFLAAGTGVWFCHDRRLSWRRVALGGCEVHVIPGEHHHALEEPHAQATAEKLRICIDGTLAPRPEGGE